MANPNTNTVGEYMTPSVVSVTEDTSLHDVLRTLHGVDVSCVLVTSAHGSPVGVVSLSDLARVSKLVGDRHAPLGLMPPHRHAWEIMKSPVLTVSADDDVSQAAAKMVEHHVHRVFVMRGDRIVGVFSSRDALRVAHLRRIETPLRELMTHPVDSVLLGDSIDYAIARLTETNRRGLAVLDGTYPVGVFTQMEAIRARALSPELRRNPVEEVVSYESITLDASTPAYRAAAQVLATRVRRILVVEGRTLVGIVSGYDLARVIV